MLLSFRPSVYWVKGAKKSCFYDLHNAKLYHLAELETHFIDSILGKPLDSLQLTELEYTAIQELFERNLLEETEGEVHYGAFEKSKFKPQITMAWIEVTQQCNLRCIHCYNESAPMSNCQMSMQSFKKVVQNLEELGVRKIQLIGGEPLCLGDRLMEMISYARPYFDQIEVFTNGTLLSNEIADFLAANGIHVALSVYSYQAQAHDKVTKSQGSHARTTAAIEKLKSRNISYRVANVLMKDIPLGEKNTDLYTLSQDRDVVRLSGRANLELLTPELIAKRLITKETFAAPLDKSLIHRNLVGHNCFARRLYISADLNVYPCVMERRLCHGSIAKESLVDILKPEILSFSKSNITGCKDCEFRYCCHDCRPDTITGNVFEKPWRCTYDPYSGEWSDPKAFAEHILSMKF